MNSNSNFPSSIYKVQINDINGELIDLNLAKGKKLLIVNTASKCGFTNQYAELQKLHEEYSESLMVLGVPCNQFGNQEPGNATEINEFCELNFGVSFTLTEKIDVKGPLQHPLYAWLTQKRLNGVKNSSVKWNFQKYLIDEEGKLIDFYYSITKPMSSKIIGKLK